MRTKSAGVVIAFSILLILVTVGFKDPLRPAQASIRSADGTEITLTSTLSAAEAPATTASPSTRYVVQYGDTLSGIAAALDVRGGWPALYAANRPLIGPNPNIIQPGTVLVLPGQRPPLRYTIASGGTLSVIAAALGVRGGWPALYAANRTVIGPDPNTIHPGTVLTIPGPAAPSPPRANNGHHRHRAPLAPASRRHRRLPVSKRAKPAVGMPRWLKIMLLAVGLLAVAAFLAEPVLVIRRRGRARTGAAPLRTADSGERPGPSGLAAEKGRIVLADYDQIVVACSGPDDTVYVLRPPGEDPRAILRAARLVLPEGPYGELADQLGAPASWPMEHPMEEEE